MALVLRLSHLAKTALSVAETEGITTNEVLNRYAGKEAHRPIGEFCRRPGLSLERL